MSIRNEHSSDVFDVHYSPSAGQNSWSKQIRRVTLNDEDSIVESCQRHSNPLNLVGETFKNHICRLFSKENIIIGQQRSISKYQGSFIHSIINDNVDHHTHQSVEYFFVFLHVFYSCA